MESYFERTAVIGGIGILCALGAWMCVAGHAKRPEDTMLFATQIPMALFGIVGYLFIAITAIGAKYLGIPFAVVNHALVIFAGLFTIYLVYRSIQVSLACPRCWMCWFVNVVLIVHVIYHFVCGKTGQT